jgi:hypothetical protein
MDVNEITFGVEIEAYGISMATVAQSLNDAGLQCRVEGYNHATSTGWKVVTDGSLSHRYSFELVSPILKGDDGLQQVLTACNAIRRAGARVSKQCGLHVHIGAGHFDLKQMQNFVKNYVFFEHFFDTIMPKSRRGNINQYIRSNRATLAGMSVDVATGEATTSAAIARAFETVNRATDITNLIRLTQGGNRYYKLNLESFHRHRTVEFRQHGGTTDGPKIVNWVKLLRAFVIKSATGQPRPRKLTTKVDASLEFSQFFTYFNCKELRPFFRSRRKFFAAQADATQIARRGSRVRWA